MKPYVSLRRALVLLDEIYDNFVYHGDMCWLFGINTDSPAHSHQDVLERMNRTRKEYLHRIETEPIYKQRISRESFDALKVVAENSEKLRKIWRSEVSSVRVLCTDAELSELLGRAVRAGFRLKMRKDELAKYFDLSNSIEYWGDLPGYTEISLGGQLAISCLEKDLFESLCWLYNQAVKSDTALTTSKDIQSRTEHHRTREIMCLQTIITSFVVLEAYLNSLARIHLSKLPPGLTGENRLYLQEAEKDKQGKIKRKTISTENKLHEWVRIISPRGVTFDKGKKPFQDFVRLKKYRDAIVHFSEDKLPR